MAKASLVCVVVGEVYERYFEQLETDFYARQEFSSIDGEWELVKLPGVAGWPSASEQRYRVILEHADEPSGDYVYLIDADSRLLAPLTEELFADGIVVSEHPGYPRDTGKDVRNLWEERIDSCAFLPPKQRERYFPGSFVGGERESFLEMAAKLADWIDADKGRGIDARWYDESYLNAWLGRFPPAKILDGRRYCYWQHWGWPAPTGTVVAHLDKSEAERAATGR